jgi:transposase
MEINSAKSPRINVLGFFDYANNNLNTWTFDESVNSKIILSLFDDLANKIKKKTYIVLDNASIHIAKIIKNKITEWEQKNLFLYYLPPYCPKLNMIEIIWNFIKYKWMPISAYTSFKNLKESLFDILTKYGSEYLITFA